MIRKISIITAIIVNLMLVIGFVGIGYAGPAVQIGEVTCIKRMINGNDVIKIIRIQDPENPFVTITFTTIKSGNILATADPSNTSVAARLIGEIPIVKGKRQINTTPNHDIAHIRKSIGSKVMKIARFYDIQMDTLTYLIYSTKIINGSLKHSLSVVPLGSPKP